MARRLDIEITSLNGQTATWRAAGAREPRGVLATTDLPTGVVVGQIFRAEIEQFMEGVEVISLAPPRAASPIDPHHERIDILTPERAAPDVQVTYASKGRRKPPAERSEKRPRNGGPDRARSVDRSDRRERPRRTRDPHANPTDETTEPRENAPKRTARPATSATRGAPRAGRTPPAGRGDERRAGSRGRPERPAQPVIPTTHRNGFLATLPTEQLPIAEELLRGGLPAVRRALEEQNRNATAQGRPPANADAILRVADELLGRANLALWKDRAAGAAAAGAELRLRDLRAVVTSAKTVILDEESRGQLRDLRTSLDARVSALRDAWAAKLEASIDRSDVDEALRLTARTPDPTTRVSATVAARVAELSSAALTAETDPARWRSTVLAAVESPIRRLIKPTGIPSDDACRELAVHSAGAIPELAKLLGMKVPPPPPASARPPRRTGTTRRSS